MLNSDIDPHAANLTTEEVRACVRGKRTGMLLPRFRRWSELSRARAAQAFASAKGASISSSTTSVPLAMPGRVVMAPLILLAGAAATMAMCVCEQFMRMGECTFGLCRRCCDGMAFSAVLSDEDVPECLAHRKDGIPLSLAAASHQGCVTSTVSLRAHFRQFLEENKHELGTTLNADSRDAIVHRFQLVLWQDGFSTLGPHLWAACVSFCDDYFSIMPMLAPKQLCELSFLQLHLVHSGAKFEQLCVTMVPIVQSLISGCAYPVKVKKDGCEFEFALDPEVALGDEQMLQMWGAISNSTPCCCSSCTCPRKEFGRPASHQTRAFAGDNCKIWHDHVAGKLKVR